MIDWLLVAAAALMLAFWTIVFVLLCRAFGILVKDVVEMWRKK